MPLSTVSLWLQRIGLGKRSRLDPLEPPNRYERRHPGELVHVDIKKLGRSPRSAPATASSATASQHTRTHRRPQDPSTGYEYLHVMRRRPHPACLRRSTRRPHRRRAIAFLRRALAWFAARGVRVERVMTDNGSCYRAIYTAACRHSASATYASAHTPRTNGCETCGRFRLGPLPGSRRCCLRVTRPNGWLVSMPLL